MRHRLLMLLNVLALMAASSILGAQDLLVEDTDVLLRIPAPLFHREQGGWSGPRVAVAVIVTATGVEVDKRSDWETAGFPVLAPRTIWKIRHDKEAGTTTIDFKTTSSLPIRMTITGDATTAFAAVAASRDAAESVRATAYRSLASVYFVGPLADLPDPTKQVLLTFADLTAKGTRIGSVTFKEKLYLVIDLGETGAVYNDLKLNQAQRVALVVNERLLTILKAFAAPVREATNIQGLKLEYNIFHKNFANQYSTPAIDKLEMYVNVDDIRTFADADITSQQLIDKSIVLVDSNRIQVPLSQ